MRCSQLFSSDNAFKSIYPDHFLFQSALLQLGDEDLKIAYQSSQIAAVVGFIYQIFTMYRILKLIHQYLLILVLETFTRGYVSKAKFLNTLFIL